jgi:hypothetical protein
MGNQAMRIAWDEASSRPESDRRTGLLETDRGKAMKIRGRPTGGNGSMKKIAIAVAVLLSIVLAPPASPVQGAPLAPQDATDPYGGYTGLHIGNNSGYFRLAQADGRWWLVTPAGNAFFSLGANTITPWGNGLYQQNIGVLYGGDWHYLPWIDVTMTRLRTWGFNTLGGNSWSSLYDQGMPYAVNLDLSCRTEDPSCAGKFPKVNVHFPDVFDGRFASSVYTTVNMWDEGTARGINQAWITDPYLIGYWLDNELWWWHDSHVIIDLRAETVVEDFIEKDCSWAGKQEWVNFLRQAHNNSIGALNSAWGSSYGSFDQLCDVTKVSYAGAANDKNAFLTHIAQRYYDITVQAVRARDPNHLILGPRFTESVPDAAMPPAAACDALSINQYVGIKPYDLPVRFRNTMTNWYNLTGKPVLVSEFSFESPDTGLPGSKGGSYKVATRAERADGYRNFAHYAMDIPNVVGLHWFQYVDQPVEGRYDGENNGNGLVDEDDAPYYDLVSAVHEVNTHIYDYLLHTGSPPLAAPRLFLPRHSDDLESAFVTFYWEAVEGASSYNVQISQHPTFPDEATVTYLGVGGNTLSHTLAHPGRWYWRVQAIGNGQESAFSAPYPMDLLDVAAVTMLSGMETPLEASVAEAENGWVGVWDSWPRHAISMEQNHTTGVTQGSYSGEAHYTGDCLYDPCKASLSRFPTGNSFSPHDWSAYDYLAYDVYNPNPNDWVAEVSVFTPSGTSGYYLWDRFAIKGGVQNYFIFDLDRPFHDGSRTNITNFAIELVNPLPNFVIYYDNVRLIDMHTDTTPPGPVTFTATDTGLGLGGAVDLDWSDYVPAPDVTGYRIYVGAKGNCNIGPGLSTPIATVDGLVTNYRARMSAPPTDQYSATRLLRGQSYCFAVTAVDWVGNEGPVSEPQLATPSFVPAIYPALPAFYGRITDVAGNPLSGVVVQLTGAGTYRTTTDSLGNYALPPVIGTYSLQASRAGYYDSEVISGLSVGQDTHRQIDLVLRSLVNLVANGDFENGSLSNWFISDSSGGTPILQCSEVRSGNGALQLGGSAGGGIAAAGTSAIGQTIAVTGLCQPVISMWYKVSGSDSQDTLEIVLDEQGTETVLRQIPLTEQDWIFVPFASSAVFANPDLLLRVRQNGSIPTTVYIDEVNMIPGTCPKEIRAAEYLPFVVKNWAP